jgi:hypothetical protein
LTTLIPPPTPPRPRARRAGEVELAVDPARFHFFDPEGGGALQLRDAGRVHGAPVPA